MRIRVQSREALRSRAFEGYVGEAEATLAAEDAGPLPGQLGAWHAILRISGTFLQGEAAAHPQEHLVLTIHPSIRTLPVVSTHCLLWRVAKSISHRVRNGRIRLTNAKYQPMVSNMFVKSWCEGISSIHSSNHEFLEFPEGSQGE